MRSIFSVLSYTRPAQLRKLEGPTCQRKFIAGRKVYFISMWRFLCSMEGILKRQSLIGGREFATFSIVEKALADRKKSFVVQVCPIP